MGAFLITAVRTALILITGITVSMMVVASVASSQSMHDPFAQYADMMPGNPREAVIEQGFQCRFNGPPFFNEFCTLNPATGVFSEITVNLSNKGLVKNLIFVPRENELANGLLVLLWGQPKVKRFSQNSNFLWPDQHTIAVTQVYYTHPSYFLPINLVIFVSAH